MIASVKGVDGGFKPININITIESEEELADLWCRLNLPDNFISYRAADFVSIGKPKILKTIDKYRSDDTLFECLDDYIKDNLPDFFESKY